MRLTKRGTCGLTVCAYHERDGEGFKGVQRQLESGSRVVIELIYDVGFMMLKAKAIKVGVNM